MQQSHQISFVSNFHQLVATPFSGQINALCYKRKLTGDFAEIVQAIALHENIVTVTPGQLAALQLSPQGQLARDIILNDFKMLEDHGGSPVLNVIQQYDIDEEHPFFSTDVYSFHVDRSPIPTDTFLCTYHGQASEILPNAQAIQKVLVPHIRAQLQQLYGGAPEGFENFLTDNFFDLHYQPTPAASPINLGLGNLWRLAVDHPQSPVLPCVHRAPKEKPGEPRLLMIC